MKIDRSEPNCPICNKLKSNHTPSEAIICFNEIKQIEQQD